MKTNLTRKFRHLGLLGAGLCFAFATNAQPVITSQPTNQSVLAGNRALLTAGVSGVGPLTFQWQLNGTNLPNNLIATIAGNGTAGFAGDGGIATTGKINQPYGVAADDFGNVFIADYSNNRIRKVSTNGVMTTVAGSARHLFFGDGGAATNAGIYSPSGVALDASGNLYIADSRNNCIRKVDTNGIITTIAGNFIPGYSGDGGAATNASLRNPYGITCDTNGNLFIADSYNNCIRKVDTNGIITTITGKSGGFSGDGGPATNAALNQPEGLALDANGNLLIADTHNNRVRKVDVYGVITTLAGNGVGYYSGDNGAATNAGMNPYAVAVDGYGDVYIADPYNNNIRRVDPYGIITTVAGTNGFAIAGTSGFGYSGDGISATNALLDVPIGVALDSYGRVLIADSANNRIRRFGQGPTLVLDAVNATNAGNYTLVVSSSFGSVTSVVATLTLLLPPTITTQPTNAKAVFGSPSGFNVAVSGTPPFGYQWFTSSGRTATALPYISGGHIFSANVIDPGMGYVSAPQVHFVGGSGSGATATTSLLNGGVLFINMMNTGSGYTTPPTIQIDPPPTINTPLPNQTNVTLTLSSVTSTDWTNYFVVVTNNYGSVTSSTVILSVFLPPQNFTVQNVVTGLQMNLTGSASYPYVLQSATNLTPPISWQSIRTNYADTNGNWQFTDTNLNFVQKFYRVLGQ